MFIYFQTYLLVFIFRPAYSPNIYIFVQSSLIGLLFIVKPLVICCNVWNFWISYVASSSSQ